MLFVEVQVGPGSKDSRSFVTPDSSIVSAPVEDIRKTLAAPDTHEPEPHRLEQIVFGSNEPEKQERQFCACWCQGWAEIHIRRPTGDVSWAMRIQNQCYYQTSPLDFPLADITTLFMPSLAGKKEDLMSSHKRINSETLAESEYDAILDQHFEHTPDDVGCTSHVLGMNTGPSGPILIPGSPLKRSISRQNSRESLDNETDCYETDGRSRNPVRRSNSSPEMSASWKNPFMNRDKEREGKPLPLPLDRDDSGEMETKQENPTEAKKPAKLSKDPRVSCEAIPEESAGQGTTPPQPSTLVSGTTNQDGHPPLVSCHSYPGTLEDEPERAPVSSHTVPPSPTFVTSPASLLSTPTSSAIHTGVFNTRSVQTLALQQRLPQTKELKSSPDIPRLSLARQHVTTSTTPTTTSQLTINTSSASADKLSVKDEPHRPDPSALPPLAFKRGRGHTISVMSPIRKPPRLDWSNASKESSPRNKDTPRSGISPSFIFLQLYHAAHFGNISDKPLLLSQSQVVQRALKNLDRIPPYETHKIGVLYVGVGQASQEADILNNQFGSLRYTEFLQRLGTLISLKDADIFLGGLDRNGNDGKFAYVWQDDVMQVTFHVATLMPNKETDPSGNGKKLHIGNDFVTIVYNESGEDYNMQTVKGQFNYACVVIQPLEHNTNQVTVKTRDDLAEHIGHSEPKIVSDQNLALLSRQLALHANLASMISRSLKAEIPNPYASNWLERLRQIKRLRLKVLQENMSATSDNSSSEKDVNSPPRRIRSNTDAKPKALIGQESAPKPPPPLKGCTCKNRELSRAAGNYMIGHKYVEVGKLEVHSVGRFSLDIGGNTEHEALLMAA
uniref:Rap-GAP domain-containing protein n=1 Tax=Timema douglasi TaxID=61478 RepID=A0A7R8VP01_TIMDO|nr:unnamed protein product [Timema douglasi]